MPGKRKDITGNMYGYLKALRFDKITDTKITRWIMLCVACNKEISVSMSNLKSGSSKSCGCMKFQLTKENKNTHNLSKHGTYRTWVSMKQRCSNPKAPDYPRYGGSGISYHPRWESFDNFLEDMGLRPKDRTLDRIDGGGPYTKENCRWADNKIQARNMKSNHVVEYNGQKKCIAEWAEIYNIPYSRLSWRIKVGWGPKKAFFTSKKNTGPKN